MISFKRCIGVTLLSLMGYFTTIHILNSHHVMISELMDFFLILLWYVASWIWVK